MLDEEKSGFQKLLLERKKREAKRPKRLTKEQQDEQTIDWCDFYRKNWEIYAIEELEIPLKPVQALFVHMVGVSMIIFMMCGRGWAKL